MNEYAIVRRSFDNSEKLDELLRMLKPSDIITVSISYIPMPGGELKFKADVLYKIKK